MNILLRLMYGPVQEQREGPLFTAEHRTEVSPLRDVTVTLVEYHFEDFHHPFVPAHSRKTTRSPTALDGTAAWRFAIEHVEQDLNLSVTDDRTGTFEKRQRGDQRCVRLMFRFNTKSSPASLCQIRFIGGYSG